MLICLLFILFILVACSDELTLGKSNPLTAVAGFALVDFQSDRPIADVETLSDGATLETGREDVSLRGNPNFSESQLPAEVRKWYRRLWGGINNPGSSTLEGAEGANIIARNGDLSRLGRIVSDYVTELLTVFRITGDLRLLDEVDRVMQLARGELRDSTGDGYLNWRWLRDPDEAFYNTDSHFLDEQLTHAMVAMVAYAFYVNADLDSRYQERANFWTDYLENHFVPKWRGRENKPTGFPFLRAFLTHGYVEWMRFHYYMHKLTGERGYLDEAERMALVIQEDMIEVGGGNAFVWDHFVRSDPHNGPHSLFCQPSIYARGTIKGMVDLANENFSIFGNDAFMRKIAGTVRDNIMDDGANSFAADVCGGRSMGGLNASGWERHNFLADSPALSSMGAWDASGKITRVAEEVYNDRERWFYENPQRPFIPAGLVFSLSR